MTRPRRARRAERRTRALAALAAAAALAAPAAADEFRALNPIRGARTGEGAPPEGGFRPVPLELVRRTLLEIADAWNTPRLRAYLSEDFYEVSRLPEATQVLVPRDALLRILAVEGISVLDQRLRPLPGGGLLVESSVSVVARTQVEFDDPATGFQRREGRNEYVFRVLEEAAR